MLISFKFLSRLIVKNGHKQKIQKLLLLCFKKLRKAQERPPIFIFKVAVHNTTPLIKVLAFNKNGSLKTFPIISCKRKRETLALRWLLEIATKNNKKKLSDSLVCEILNSFSFRGVAYTKKVEIEKTSENINLF